MFIVWNSGKYDTTASTTKAFIGTFLTNQSSMKSSYLWNFVFEFSCTFYDKQ